ncbi:MAG: DUF5114 domain-containing protein [Bacteroidota bacterium]|nr:DUF5114 domain-containing protein [Bacteroidota bacterium]
MKKILGILLSGLLLVLLPACNKDGDLFFLSGMNSNELMANATDVVLTVATRDSVALSLAWTKSTLSVSNPDVSVPDNILSYTLQASASADFSTTLVESSESNLSKSYLGSELNTVATSLGLAAGTAVPVYFRLKGSIGNNMQPVYSNVVTVNVTPYRIDFTTGYILNASQEVTGTTLYSATENGIYTGFMGATAWYNFYLKEGDGTIWGNDGVSGTAFLLSSENDAAKRWNCWFPGIGGCYYTTVNTVTKQWSALLLPALTVSGDIQGDMTFDRPNVRWTKVFQATSNSISIQLSGTGNLYDYTTGTTDANAISKTFGFTGTPGALQFASQAQALTLTLPSTGTYTLVVDLSNPKALKVEAVQGTEEPDQVNQFVYLAGIDDGITGGSWNFDNTLKLYNEDNLSYAGVINANSKWGYGVNVEKDNWTDLYNLGSGDAYSGTLVYKGTANLPAPTPGLYLFDVSLKGLTYSLTSIGSVIYVSGLNDVWDLTTTLAETSTAGVYSGTVTITKASQWGFKILLDTSWNLFYGGSGGALSYKGSNLTDDASLAAGSYTLNVNLVNRTYSFTSL